MIRGVCRTNLDEAKKYEWPVVFAEVPTIGHRVQAENGRSLKVCSITHYQIEVKDNITGRLEYEPRIEVELNR